MVNRKNSRRVQAWTQIGVVIAVAFALNIIASFYYKRIDLTADKRYTLSDKTKELVSGLKDVVFVTVYLEGDDLPPGFRNLSNATRDMLDEFRELAGDKVQYQFINPSDAPDTRTRQDLYEQLENQGLNRVNLEVGEGDKLVQKIIFPGAIVTYNNQNTAVTLLQQQMGNIPPEQVLHNSIVGLEYQLANAIYKLQNPKKPKVGIIQGHGELTQVDLADITRTLREYYEVDYINLPEYKVGRLDPYKAIIIAKPDSFFTEVEKYKIDQYIMNGGRVLWCVEPLNAEIDSLLGKNVFYSSDKRLNIIEDQLFRYGVRFNYNLVQDLNSGFIPLVEPYGGQQRATLKKWPYDPIAVPRSDNPIVHNLNAIWFSFACTIDTISGRYTSGLKKTVLLQTSPYTRVKLNPVEVDVIKTVTQLPNEQQLFDGGQKILSVLLEGSFTSAFLTRRPTDETLSTGEYGAFKDKSVPTRMIFISDGDVIRNRINMSQGKIYPLGYDSYTNTTFGNKTFILNCMDYLVNESDLISLRSKDFRLRLLDTARIKTEGTQWQLVNLAVPVVLIGLFGIIFNFIRKRRFAR